MNDPSTTLGKGRPRHRSHPILVTALNAVWISFLFLILIVSLNVSYTERKIEEQLESLANIFSSHDFPHSCDARHFPFFFSLEGETVNIADKSADDWEDLYATALDRGTIKHSEKNPDVHFAELPCGIAVTRNEARHIVDLRPRGDTEFKIDGFDFSLWLARDDENGVLYVLGLIASTGRETFPDRFRLILDYDDRSKEAFVIEREETGDLTWDPHRLQFPTPPVVTAVRNPVGRYGTEFSGAWWNDSPSPGVAHQFLEIRLQDTNRVTALEIFAERLSDKGRLELRVGTRAPVPLYQDMRSYQVTRHLSRNVEYELYSLETAEPIAIAQSPTPGGTIAQRETPSLEPEATSPSPHATGILDFLYGVSFLVMGYDRCPTEESESNARTGSCYRFSEDTPGPFRGRIRMGKLLSPHEPALKDRIVIVEGTPEIGYREIILTFVAILFIMALIWRLAKTSKRRRQALVEQNRTLDDLQAAHRDLRSTHVDLEEKNSSLERMNIALENYDRIFLHQAFGDMLELKSRVEKIIDSSSLQGSVDEVEVDGLIDKVMDRLERSTEVFRYPTIIRNLISTHGHNRLSLEETIEVIVEDRETDVRFEPMLENGEKPWIPATSSTDPESDEPDNYFAEAMEMVLGNANDYRTPGTKVVVSLSMDQGDAVVQVSNQGPTVPEDKLETVFEFGARLSGAGNATAKRVSRVDPGRRHLGLGLFVTRQIVEGFRGTCSMVNKSGGSGVTVTIRLPCSDGDVPALQTQSGFQ